MCSKVYEHSSVQNAGRQFDAVMGLEIIEHVDKPREFIRTLSSLTKSDGALFISTINRTPRGYLVAVLGAEYVARILPKGTHDWHKFVTPGKAFTHDRCKTPGTRLVSSRLVLS